MINHDDTWPPARRCENCDHWRSPRWFRLFRMHGKLGVCGLDKARTWKSYFCRRHSFWNVLKGGL